MKNAIATAIYTILKADNTLMAAISGVYHVIAKQMATFPYVSFGILTGVPMGTFASPRAVDDTTWWFNVFSKTGSKDAGTIAGLLADVLDNASLTVSGYSALKCTYEFTGSDIYDPETEVYQIPLRYRIWVDKN